MKENEEQFLPKQIRNYLNYASVIRGLSKETIYAYKCDLMLFARYIIAYEDTPSDIYEVDLRKFTINVIKKITLEDLYGFLSFAENNRKNSAYARAKKVSALRSFFKYLNVKAKLLDNNITLDLEKPKIPKTLPKYLTHQEAEKLIEFVKGRNEIRDKCILILFLTTGIRLSELCGINVEDIRDGFLTVTGKGNKERKVPLTKGCMSEIKYYIKFYRTKKLGPDALNPELFISERKQRMHKRTVQHVVENAIKTSSISKKYSTHKLRHTAATMLYSAGADIRSLQTILGHTKLDTTQIYTHINEEELKNVVELNPLKF